MSAAHDGPVKNQVAEAVENWTSAVNLDALNAVWSVTADHVRSSVDRGVCDSALVLANGVASDSPVQRYHKQVNRLTEPPHVLEKSGEFTGVGRGANKGRPAGDFSYPRVRLVGGVHFERSAPGRASVAACPCGAKIEV